MQTLEMIPHENPDEMSPEAFYEMMIQHQIGGFGKDFLREHIEDHLLSKSAQIRNKSKINQNFNPAF